jgi:hypothetical protein
MKPWQDLPGGALPSQQRWSILLMDVQVQAAFAYGGVTMFRNVMNNNEKSTCARSLHIMTIFQTGYSLEWRKRVLTSHVEVPCVYAWRSHKVLRAGEQRTCHMRGNSPTATSLRQSLSRHYTNALQPSH